MAEGWQSVSLGEVAALRRRSLTVRENEEYIRVTLRLRGQGMVRRDSVFGRDLRIKRQFAVRTGDFVVAEIDAKVGGMAVVPPTLDGAVVSSHYFAFELDPSRVLPEWVSLLCESNHFTRQVQAVGSTNYAAVRPVQVLDYALPLPPLPEQRRVVNLIAAVADAVVRIEVERGRLAVARAAVAADILGRGDVEKVAVKHLAVPGGLVGGPFGSSLVSKDYTEMGVPVIRGANLSTGSRFIGGEFAYVSPAKAAALRHNSAEPDDVIATQRGTLGQVGLVPALPYATYVVSQSQMRLRVDPRKARPDFVFIALSSAAMVNEIESRKIATANPHINLGIFGSLEIPVPDLATQDRVVATVLAIEDLQRAVVQEQQAQRTLRTALLSDLLVGEHEIPDSYDRFLDGAA